MKNVLALSLVAAAAIVLFGCGPKNDKVVYVPPVQTTYGREPDDPDTALTEQMRQGAVQMSAASETVETALNEAKRTAKALSGEAKLAAQDVVDLLDDAGASVADASSDPPQLEDVKKDFAAVDDDRKKRIESGNDAYRSIEIALGTLEGLEQGVDGLQALNETLALALNDVADAIEAYGGKVESDEQTSEAPKTGGK